MTTIHEIQQLIYINTPHGEAQALFIIDYGIHENTIWVSANKKDGKIRHYNTNQISIVKNNTIDFMFECFGFCPTKIQSKAKNQHSVD